MAAAAASSKEFVIRTATTYEENCYAEKTN